MTEEKLLKCISCMLGDDILSIETLRSEIYEVSRCLEQLCSSSEKLEEFLSSYDEQFIVENDKVTAYSSHLESGLEKAVKYFECELEKEIEKYGECPVYQNFRGHIGQADRDVMDYINLFYPEDEFKDFLLEYPDVFVVFDNDTVNLIETESANYFRKFVSSDGIHVKDLRYQTLYAPDYIRTFINTNYEDDFLEFLENNSDFFYVEDDYVYLS